MCRYAELLADSRTFTEEEDAYFSEQAQYAYESFRNKAALSRGMQNEQMQQHAQVPASCLFLCSFSQKPLPSTDCPAHHPLTAGMRLAGG